jgi:hypothetical protein
MSASHNNFLAGTNIGAAVYEYGVARLSFTLLKRRALRIAPARLNDPEPERDRRHNRRFPGQSRSASNEI